MFNKTWLKLIVYLIITENLVLTQNLNTCVFNEETRDFSIFYKDKKFRVQIGKADLNIIQTTPETTTTITTTTKETTTLETTTKEITTQTLEFSCPESYQHFSQSSGNCVNNVCTCDNGRIIHYTKCFEHGGNNCRFCWAGYERVEVSENVFHCQNLNPTPEPTTITYPEIPCPLVYQHFDKFSGECVDNFCTCTNGTSSYGYAKCLNNGDESCTSCDFSYTYDGYRVFEMVKVAEIEDTYSGIYHCKHRCEHYQYRDDSGNCVNKQCTCENGSATITNCTIDNSEKCETCDEGYHMLMDLRGFRLDRCVPICAVNEHLDENMTCVKNEENCFCSNGTRPNECSSISAVQYDNGLEDCESCDSGYKLWYYNKGFKCIPASYNTICTTGRQDRWTPHIDYAGFCDIGTHIKNVPDWQTCHQYCQQNLACVAFVYNNPKNRCYLKNDQCNGITYHDFDGWKHPYTVAGVKGCCDFLDSARNDISKRDIEIQPWIKTDNGKCECDESAAYMDEDGLCQLKKCQCEDGIATKGTECPAHNATGCAYSGTIESEHPKKTSGLSWYNYRVRHWYMENPSGRFFKLEFEKFETWSWYSIGGGDRKNRLTIMTRDEGGWTTSRNSFGGNTGWEDFVLCNNSPKIEFTFSVDVNSYHANVGDYYGWKMNWKIVDSCDEEVK